MKKSEYLREIAEDEEATASAARKQQSDAIIALIPEWLHEYVEVSPTEDYKGGKWVPSARVSLKIPHAEVIYVTRRRRWWLWWEAVYYWGHYRFTDYMKAVGKAQVDYKDRMKQSERMGIPIPPPLTSGPVP